jgi:Flp pilus assembly protein TadD
MEPLNLTCRHRPESIPFRADFTGTRRALLLIHFLCLSMIVLAQSAPVSRPPSAQATVSHPTWSSPIARILQSNCTTCHHPGGAGPFSLLTYEDAHRWAPQILDVTQSRFMPPWLPEPGYGNLADARRLSDSDRALLKRWIEAGLPPGDMSVAPNPPGYSSTWTLGKPDLILSVEKPFTVAAGGQDVFRNFILPYTLDQTHYVRAMEILPGAARIVHHANVLIDRTAEYRRQHPADWQSGVPGMELAVDAGKSFDPDSHFLFWKPDTPALVEPEGMPWRLEPGNDLILNMHLKPTGKEETVQAQIGLYFTDNPPTQFPMLLQLDRDDALDIPAGQADFKVEDELTLPVAVQLLGIYPHAHYIGKEMQAWATLPDGKKVWLIWIRSWDIDRQSVYRYSKPVLLAKGTVVHMRYIYDNSSANAHNPHSPPVRVRAGNRSDDEMAHLWLQVLPVGGRGKGEPDPRLLLEEAWMRSRLRKTPSDSISLYNLGAALVGENKPAEAVEVFKKLVEVQPADGRGWNALASATQSVGDLNQAKFTFMKAIEVEPGNCNARFNLAELDLSLDLVPEAEHSFRSFLETCPDDAEARNGLGLALIAQRQFEQAQAQFVQGLTLNPGTDAALDLHQHLAFADAQSGQTEDAIAQLRMAIELAPEDAAPHALLAQLLSQAGRMAEAIAEQKAALRLHKDDADGWNNLGAYEAQTGDIQAARNDFHEALRIDSHNAQAEANLSRLSIKP